MYICTLWYIHIEDVVIVYIHIQEGPYHSGPPRESAVGGAGRDAPRGDTRVQTEVGLGVD